MDSSAPPDLLRPFDLKFMQLVVDLPCGRARAALIVKEYRHFADMNRGGAEALAEHKLACQ